MISTATNYRCQYCGGPIPMEPLARHVCPPPAPVERREAVLAREVAALRKKLEERGPADE